MDDFFGKLAQPIPLTPEERERRRLKELAAESELLSERSVSITELLLKRKEIYDALTSAGVPGFRDIPSSEFVDDAHRALAAAHDSLTAAVVAACIVSGGMMTNPAEASEKLLTIEQIILNDQIKQEEIKTRLKKSETEAASSYEQIMLTIGKRGKASPESLFNRQDLDDIKLNVAKEAGGEVSEKSTEFKPWFAVAAVTMNRTLDTKARWQDTPRKTIYQRFQFSWTILSSIRDRPIEKKQQARIDQAFKGAGIQEGTSFEVARRIMLEKSGLDEFTFWYKRTDLNPMDPSNDMSLSSRYFFSNAELKKEIGNHTFYGDIKAGSPSFNQWCAANKELVATVKAKQEKKKRSAKTS